MKKEFSINVISTACGVMPHTIRMWEKRYQIFTPKRSEGGQRLYSEVDLDKAKIIVSLKEQGHTISSLARHSLQDLRSLLEVNNRADSESEKMFTSIETKKLLKHLENFDIDLVVSGMQHLRLSMGVKEFIFKIVLPVMHEIEKLSLKGTYSITQEHIISTIVRDQLNQINLANEGPNTKRFALATPDGNLHELPIMIAEIICHANRVSTNYLGASHPAECLGEAVNAIKCKTIVMGVISSAQWNYEKNIVKYLESIDKCLRNKVEIILGGGYKIDLPNFKNIENVKFVSNFEDFDKMLKEIK
ncbi:MAG: MerR family transcriptional regulator [SAR324 cluster bacterium]|jgi:DNA-binding transcriptional MerR regulator|nr:MerR family transcriptional regulator [SAR324 cluster bacterium]|tara:strand:+ start:2384 stop:3292 length:909 start_codon:yes stop_codon:yes gene_type:complete